MMTLNKLLLVITVLSMTVFLVQSLSINSKGLKRCLSACGGGLRSAVATKEFLKYISFKWHRKAGISGGSWGIGLHGEIAHGFSMKDISSMTGVKRQWNDWVGVFNNFVSINKLESKCEDEIIIGKSPHYVKASNIPDQPDDSCTFSKGKAICGQPLDQLVLNCPMALALSGSALTTNAAFSKVYGGVLFDVDRFSVGDYDLFDLGAFDNCPILELSNDCDVIYNLHASEELDYYDNTKHRMSSAGLNYMWTKEIITDKYNKVELVKYSGKRVVFVVNLQTWEASKEWKNIPTWNQFASDSRISDFKEFMRNWITRVFRKMSVVEKWLSES